MSKFHVNDQGVPGMCFAQISCPFGAWDEHFETKKEAREFYEDKMVKETIPKSIVKKILKSKLTRDHESALLAGAKIAEYRTLEWLKIVSDAHRNIKKLYSKKSDEDFINRIINKESFSVEELDNFLHDNRYLNHYTNYNSSNAADGANLLTFLRAVRGNYPEPSTLPTTENFDPSTESVFVNDAARNNPERAYVAIKRTLLNAEKYKAKADEAAELMKTYPDNKEYKEKVIRNDDRCDIAIARAGAMMKEVRFLSKESRSFKYYFQKPELNSLNNSTFGDPTIPISPVRQL